MDTNQVEKLKDFILNVALGISLLLFVGSFLGSNEVKKPTAPETAVRSSLQLQQITLRPLVSYQLAETLSSNNPSIKQPLSERTNQSPSVVNAQSSSSQINNSAVTLDLGVGIDPTLVNKVVNLLPVVPKVIEALPPIKVPIL